MPRPPRAPVSGVETQADLLANLSRRLAAIERLGHRHDTDGRIIGLTNTTATGYTNATATETVLTSTGGTGNVAPSLTLALRTDHLYHAHFDGRFISTVLDDTAIARFYEGANQRKGGQLRLLATQNLVLGVDWIFTPASAASTVYQVRAARVAGTGTISLVASTTSPTQFWIKDLGHL